MDNCNGLNGERRKEEICVPCEKSSESESKSSEFTDKSKTYGHSWLTNKRFERYEKMRNNPAKSHGSSRSFQDYQDRPNSYTNKNKYEKSKPTRSAKKNRPKSYDLTNRSTNKVKSKKPKTYSSSRSAKRVKNKKPKTYSSSRSAKKTPVPYGLDGWME